MFEFVTPHGLFRTQIHTLRATLPGVLDGAEESIHDARIATRRIRELLPLLGDPKRRKPVEDLYLRFKRVGRSLGRVRDADVRVTLLATLESRIPHATPALVVLRQQREHERLQLLRKLVKRLERLEAVRMIETLDDQHLSLTGPLSWSLRAGHTWKRDLRYTLRERAAATTAAIEHATGVYFPRRVHGARIEIKKLRYAMEIAHETGSADRSAAIRELKKTQDVLGDLHDRQELVDNLVETCPADKPEIADQVSLLKQVIDAENHDLHQRYLARRAALLDICRQERQQVHRMPTRSLVAAGAVAISSGLYANLAKLR
jgi:CHAD domain-containing protein